MVTRFAIVVCVLAFIMIVSTVVQYSRKKITASWALFWTGLWIIGTVAFFFTGILDRVGGYLIQDDGRQLAIYSAILILFYICYRLFLAVQRLNASISKLVEELARRKEK